MVCILQNELQNDSKEQSRGATMHIHGNQMNAQMLALGASQSTQQAAEAKKAAAAVRRKLSHFAATTDLDAVAEIHEDSDPASRKQRQSETDSFKSFFSVTA